VSLHKLSRPQKLKKNPGHLTSTGDTHTRLSTYNPSVDGSFLAPFLGVDSRDLSRQTSRV